jgi:hypothetical protein
MFGKKGLGKILHSHFRDLEPDNEDYSIDVFRQIDPVRAKRIFVVVDIGHWGHVAFPQLILSFQHLDQDQVVSDQNCSSLSYTWNSSDWRSYYPMKTRQWEQRPIAFSNSTLDSGFHP